MINGIKQQQNGKLGETRTEALLANAFWVLRRSVDIDGADFLVQIPAEKTEELRSRRTEILGIVQAKFFEGTNQVRIRRSYVENSEGARSDFFALLHTDSDSDKELHYFFSATQIMDFFYLSECGHYYCFSITAKRDYSTFRNLPKNIIFKAINSGLAHTEVDRNNAFLQSFYFFRGATRLSNDESYIYMLRVLENTPIVLVKLEGNEEGQSASILEPRPDLYTYSGGFAWGYAGTGPQFLCASILGHHLAGRPPTCVEREILLRKIVEKLPSKGPAFYKTPYNITTAMIDRALEDDIDEYTVDYVNYVKMFREKYCKLRPNEIANEMVNLIGTVTISFLDDPTVDAICLNPHENFLRVIKNESDDICMEEKLSTEKIHQFIAAAAIYSGRPLNTHNPIAWIELPPHQFNDAWIQIVIPPIAEDILFCINTKARTLEGRGNNKVSNLKVAY